MDIIKELGNGNVDVLLSLHDSDRKYAIKLVSEDISKNKILNVILPIFRNKNDWYSVEKEIFELIYLDKSYNEYTFYLLHKEYVKLVDLNNKEILNLLNYTSWGIDYVLSSLNKIVDNDELYRVIKILLDYSKCDNDKYKMIKDRIFSLRNHDLIEEFVLSSLDENINFTEDEIKSCLYNNPDEYYYYQETLPFYEEEVKLYKSAIPASILYAFDSDNDLIKSMFINSFQLFMTSEKKNKMYILECFYDDLSTELQDKYKDIYNFFKLFSTTLLDRYITTLINNEKLEYFLNLIRGKNISYLNCGTTTMAFKMDNLVLKLSGKKHDFNTVKDLFLLAPTETKIIYDNNNFPVLIIEIQQFLEKIHDGKMMTCEDIDNLFNELDNLGYVITDPRCLTKSFENFGFLNDYHDANLVGVDSHDDLPEWFRKRPIVLYDIDLVYKKDCVNKKVFGKCL